LIGFRAEITVFKPNTDIKKAQRKKLGEAAQNFRDKTLRFRFYIPSPQKIPSAEKPLTG
jgi:hypothetical protein